MAEWAKAIAIRHEAKLDVEDESKGYGYCTKTWEESADEVVPYPEWREPARVIADVWSYCRR